MANYNYIVYIATGNKAPTGAKAYVEEVKAAFTDFFPQGSKVAYIGVGGDGERTRVEAVPV